MGVGVGVSLFASKAKRRYLGVAVGVSTALAVSTAIAVSSGTSVGVSTANAGVVITGEGASAGVSAVTAYPIVVGASAGIATVTGVAGGWTPAALGAKLVDYWQSHLGITLNGSDVSAWTGQANGVVLAQATEAKQPPYDTVNTINGHSVVAPAGAEGLTLPALGCATSAQACLVMVVRTASTAAVQILCEANADFTANGIGMDYSFSAGGRMHLNCNGSTGDYTFIRAQADSPSAGAWHIVLARYDTTQVADLDQMSLRVDGADVTMLDSVGSATSGNLGDLSHSIFSSNNCATYCYVGRCACIVLMRDLPTAGELADLEAWIALEYAL